MRSHSITYRARRSACRLHASPRPKPRSEKRQRPRHNYLPATHRHSSGMPRIFSVLVIGTGRWGSNRRKCGQWGMMAEETRAAAPAEPFVISEEGLRKAEEYVQQEEGAGN